MEFQSDNYWSVTCYLLVTFNNNLVEEAKLENPSYFLICFISSKRKRINIQSRDKLFFTILYYLSDVKTCALCLTTAFVSRVMAPEFSMFTLPAELLQQCATRLLGFGGKDQNHFLG